MMQSQSKPAPTTAAPGTRLFSRVISGVFFSISIAFLLHESEIRDGAMGKAAYVASQAARYDQYLAQPKIGVMIISFVMLGLVFIAYELLSYGIFRVLAPRPPKEDAVISNR